MMRSMVYEVAENGSNLNKFILQIKQKASRGAFKNVALEKRINLGN